MTIAEEGLAVFGGTFDPVHFGHLGSAAAARVFLGVPRVKLVPSFVPPHRQDPSSTPSQRLSMLRMATCEDDTLEVDDREIARQGVSYTVDTLASFRAELGQTSPLYFILGIDSYCTLQEWGRWQSLTDIVHLLVLDRPGYCREIPDEVLSWSKDRVVDSFKAVKGCASGAVCITSLAQINVSSTQIREMLKAGERPTGKMPEEAIDFAIDHGLYCDSLYCDSLYCDSL